MLSVVGVLGQTARHMQFQAVAEHVGPKATPSDWVVPVGRGVDQGFEHGADAELGHFGPRYGLGSGHHHIPLQEVQRLEYLRVQRSGDVPGICLAIDVGPVSGVADSLDLGMGESFRGIRGTH